MSDPDNWFDEPDTSSAWEARSEREVRERESGAARPPDRLGPRGRQGLVVAAILVVVLLIGLAAGGVFSGGGAKVKTLSTASRPAPTTTAQTTTTKASQAPPAPTTPLKPGDTGDAVKTLQRALAYLGYAVGAIDGSYGPSTTNAVTRFQRAHGLKADGVLGPKTRAAIKQALAAG